MDLAERARADVVNGLSEVSVIEDVIGIGANLEVESLDFDDPLEHAQIGVGIVRTTLLVALEVSKVDLRIGADKLSCSVTKGQIEICIQAIGEDAKMRLV